MPDQPFFIRGVEVLELSAVVFLFNLNLVLKRLGAMLPDETLRSETRQFTAFNRWLLVALLFMVVGFVSSSTAATAGTSAGWCPGSTARLLLIFFILLPLAMTMALIWKTKEVILDAVFGAK